MNTLFLLWVTVQAATFISGQKPMKLSGRINFIPPYDGRIPSGSCILIKVLDARLMDAPSKEIARKSVMFSDIDAKPFAKLPIEGSDYTMTFAQPKAMTYTLDATINMGWCAQEDASDWIRDGDYLTTTSVELEVTKSHSINYTKDIDVEYYGKRPVVAVNDAAIDACKVHCVNGFCNSHPNGTVECVHVPEPCAIPSCSGDYAPVCGTDGKTYRNGCILQGETCPGGIKNALKIAHDGPCGIQIPFRQSVLLTIALLLLVIMGLATATWVWSHNRKRRNSEDIKKIAPIDA